MSTEQSHRFHYPPPVLFLLQTPFSQVVGLREAGGGSLSELALSMWGRPRKLCPTASYLTGLVFRDSSRQQMKFLPRLRNWQKASILCTWFSFSLSFLPLKRKTQKNASDLCKWGYANRVASFALWSYKGKFVTLHTHVWMCTHTHIHIYIPNQWWDFVYIVNKYYFFFKKKKKEKHCWRSWISLLNSFHYFVTERMRFWSLPYSDLTWAPRATSLPSVSTSLKSLENWPWA